jgi:hypothetical protein
MYRDCGVSWHGPSKRNQIEIGRDANKFFDENNRDIEIEIEGKTYYTHLPNSFFSKCKHLRTAYDNDKGKGVNYLHEWVDKNNVRRVKLEIIEKSSKYKLTKIE